MGERKNSYNFWQENVKENDHVEDLDIDVKMGLKETGWDCVVSLKIETNSGIL
jgi:hypothetical protein